jgi:hypothetical protein
MKDSQYQSIIQLLQGLTTDGAHHKQYYLEQALRALCKDEYVDETKRALQWQDGIPS